MLALNGEHHGAHLAGLWRSPKSREVRSKGDSAIRHAGELTHPALSSRLGTLNKGILFYRNDAGISMKTKDRFSTGRNKPGMF
jgi:hypothetical protein